MILVTGASRGIGLAISNRLLERGEEVLGVSRTATNTEFETRLLDVTDFRAIKNLSDEIRLSGKKVTAVINVAGIASMNLALMANPLTSVNLVHVNFLGTVYSCQAFAPLLVRNGGGTIINFSTIAATLHLEGESIYAATKAAVENYSKTFAKELSEFNVRVNCIAPGPIRTDLLRGVTEDQINRIVKAQILAKQFEKDDVVDLVDLLLDHKAKSLTGQVFHVGGVR
jgi:3-oxoacyl-[acyl-carrier protein] reductase